MHENGVLKSHDLITSPAFIVIKAASEFKDKTTAINQLWQTDFTYLKVIGWGWFYLSTILDDYSRYIPRSVVVGLPRRLFSRSRILPGGFYSEDLKWIRRAIAFEVAHQNMDAIEAEILARGIPMPKKPGKCAMLAILRPTDDAVTHGIEAVKQGIHPCAVIASPELMWLCARKNDRLTYPTGAQAGLSVDWQYHTTAKLASII